MHHPTLGELKSTGTDEGAFEGEIKSKAYNIRLNLELDSAPQEAVFKFAENVIASLASLGEKAKDAIGRDLLETYNTGWNTYDEVQEDGSTKTVVNPKLEFKQFISQFELSGLTILGAECVQLWYKPNDLFWGHSVFVTTFDGLEFNQPYAEMFG